MDDSDIVDLLFARSERAIGLMAEKYGKICQTVSKNIVGSAEDAAECVNDAYLGVWNTVPPERPNPLRTYLLRVVRNLSLKKHRDSTAKKRDSRYDESLAELQNTLADLHGPEEALEAAELSGIVNDFLDGLGRTDRYLFVRRYWYCDSAAHIAAALGISAGTAAVRLMRLREKLRARLLKEGYFV